MVNKWLIGTDIVEAISYFGVDELLDTIGLERINTYLAKI